MAIDLSRLGAADSADTLLPPRDIFAALPAKSPRYQYPRDVQSEVWAAWFARREARDVVLKMNTGSGKTVVGLLILKSCINERKGPAVYLTPDNFLVSQVVAEADALGLLTTTDPTSPQFLTGKAILVANVYRLFNGRSVFGVGNEGSRIRIGSIVLDDVHACLATTEEQFTLRVNAPSTLYDSIFSLFKDALTQQSPTSFLDVEAHDPGKFMLVPFWSWRESLDAVARLLHSERNSDEIKFNWPLVKDVLALCQCVVGTGSIELSTRCLPIRAIPSFVDATRRIFMTATLADDSILVSNFDADPGAARAPITPDSANDVGERLILVPQELNPELSDGALADFAQEVATEHNVVVIVPSGRRADFWASRAKLTLNTTNLAEGVERLKAGHVGLCVIVNRYDGIDLPNTACRLLIIDGVPDVRRGIDRIEEAMLYGTQEYLAQVMQRIEQGMGRGVRSSEDHCVVLLMGRSLTKQLYADGALSKMTPATRAQFELSSKLGEQVRGKGTAELSQAVGLVLSRNKEWVKLAKGVLAHAKYDTIGNVSQIAIRQREAFNAADAGDFQRAAHTVQASINACTEPRVRGWLKQQLAEYYHPIDPVEAQVILRSAQADNRLCLRPLDGIAYQRLSPADQTQARLSGEFIGSIAATGNELLVAVYGQLEQLKFLPGTSNVFEAAVAWLALLLGFRSQRPEAEFGHGPDVLWAAGELRYFVIECKNGVTNGIVSKADCNQLNGSTVWFGARYDATCTQTPIMIHPTNLVHAAASPLPEMRIINIECLSKLKDAVRAYAAAASSTPYPPGDDKLAGLLARLKLRPADFLDAFTVRPRHDT